MQKNYLPQFFSSYGINHYLVDRPFQLALQYGGLSKQYEEELIDLGEYAGRDLLEILDYIDHYAPPVLQPMDIVGNRINWVRLNPAHKKMLENLMSRGIVSKTFKEKAPWQLHYAMGYLIADTGVYCTITLTQQTAYALYKYADSHTLETFLPHYLTRDGRKAWFGATFYTETQGGSDLGANRAVARMENGQWVIDSLDKYFASNAGIADGALVTARPEGAPDGAKGLALFFVPALREDGSPNYHIRRLKSKLATRAVPTGEVELINSQAYLLGLPRDGIYEAMEVLTIARLANAIGAVGVARKAYLEAYYFAQRRESFGKKLIEHPLIQKDLLEMEIEIEANLIFLMKAIESFNRSWQSRPPYDEKYFYTRLLGHIVKNMTADMSARVTQLAMELHGGNGFMEDFPVARWHREALVTPIWEGGSNIQALDMLEVMIKKQAHLILFDELQKILEQHPDNVSTPVVKAELDNIRSEVDKMLKMSQPEVQYFVKELLNKLGKLTTAVFLINADEFTLQQANDNRFHILNNLYQKKYIRNVALDLSDIQRGLPIIDIQKELIPESI